MSNLWQHQPTTVVPSLPHRGATLPRIAETAPNRLLQGYFDLYMVVMLAIDRLKIEVYYLLGLRNTSAKVRMQKFLRCLKVTPN